MRAFHLVVILCAFAIAPSWAADEMALNAPDQLAWQIFIQVNTAMGKSATFETWASDTDTFQISPQFPSAPAPLILHPPVVALAGFQAIQRSGVLVPVVPPNPVGGEETRRNRAAFDFIVSNKLQTTSGLRAAFGKNLSFPVDSIEVKANWIPVTGIPSFTNNKVSAADVLKLYHVNTGSDGRQYALVSMHIISKLVPNWTWATFEHRLNPRRCDILGCRDLFGAQPSVVAPNAQPNASYADCAKTPALSALIANVNWDKAFANYCLKGSQTDFEDSSGLAIRLGNSVTEDGFVSRSSCMTCHSRAGWDQSGAATSNAGFDDNTGLAPLGPVNPAWYWTVTSTPPIFQGMPGLKQIATSADFVWSLPFCAVDDSVNPPTRSRCSGK